MGTKAARKTLLILLAFLGLGAMSGGAVLIISPMGNLIGMQLSMLVNSPFHTFVIPGIILFAAGGLVPCLLIIALLKQSKSVLVEKLNFFRVYIGHGHIVFT